MVHKCVGYILLCHCVFIICICIYVFFAGSKTDRAESCLWAIYPMYIGYFITLFGTLWLGSMVARKFPGSNGLIGEPCSDGAFGRNVPMPPCEGRRLRSDKMNWCPTSRGFYACKDRHWSDCCCVGHSHKRGTQGWKLIVAEDHNSKDCREACNIDKDRAKTERSYKNMASF